MLSHRIFQVAYLGQYSSPRLAHTKLIKKLQSAGVNVGLKIPLNKIATRYSEIEW